MNNNFWKKIPKPFFVLAPMLDITDSPFRQIVSQCGKPDVFFTWFVSVDGLCSAGKNNILIRPNLKITKKERPIVVQLFGKDPEKFEEAAKIVAKLGFDGIDINMGCPDKDVLKQGAGAELIKNPKLAREIIKAVKRGAGKIPVSVKTRVGFYKSSEMKNWMGEILKEKPTVICLHARTAKQRYGGEADWKLIKEAVFLAKGSGTLIIGNGDVKSIEDGLRKAKESKAEGIMIGREILNNPWVFNKNNDLHIRPCQSDCYGAMTDNFIIAPPKNRIAIAKCVSLKDEVSKEEKIKMLIKHATIFERYYKNIKGFNNFKKYLKAYVSGFDGSKELRMKLMEAKNAKEVAKFIKS